MLEDKKVNEQATAANNGEGVTEGVRTKTCSKCGEVKPLEDFHKNKASKDGRLSTCKVCCAVQKKEHNAKDEVKKANAAYQASYYEANKETIAAQQRKYQSSDAWKASQAKSNKKRRIKSPEKGKAQNAVNYAIATGKLTRPTICSCCHQETPNMPTQGHHWSYLEENRLSVIWLCKACHDAEHKLIDASGWPSSKRLLLND